MKALRLFAVTATCAFLFTSCEISGGNDTPTENQEMVNPGYKHGGFLLAVGESVKVDPTLTWVIQQNDDVISMDNDGTVKGLTRGSAFLNGSSKNGDIVAICDVYVYNEVYSAYKDYYPIEGSTLFDAVFIRHWLLMTELRGDNVCLSGKTEDPLYHDYRYSDQPNLNPNRFMWYFNYRMIDLCNRELSSDGLSDFERGEMLFLRSFSYFVLVNLYAPQYSLGKDNPGVPVVLTPDQQEEKTETVGAVYDVIVEDLREAAKAMSSTPFVNSGKASATAAKALLSRVYLYMGKNQECLDVCNELLAGGAKLDSDLSAYPKNVKGSKETIWCIAHEPEDTKERASIGSMYYTEDFLGGTGWGEMYWADPLMELFLRYPSDKRFKAYFSQFWKLDDGTKMIHWPIDAGDGTHKDAIVGGVNKGLLPDSDGNYSFSWSGEEYKAVPIQVNGYLQYQMNYNGEPIQVYVRDNTDLERGTRHGRYPCYFMTKFSGQDGDPNLSSPAMIRWAEVLLNHAEACAKLGMNQNALDDVNVLRNRAGLSGEAMMTEGNLAERGYDSVLDAVLDERRMELCFEGHRVFDVFRNKKALDRRYAGVHEWEVINYDDDRIPYKRPF